MIDYTGAAKTSTAKILKLLKTTPQGLEEKEAEERLKSLGENVLSQKKITALKIFLRQFRNVFLYLLIGASVISLFLGKTHEAVTILIIIFLTSLLGFFLEYRSEKAAEKLASFLKENCWVKRGNKKIEVDRKRLVPGDIVCLQAGDIVPADCRLLVEENLMVDESVFTGESLLTNKKIAEIAKIKSVHEAKNLLFAGTAVQSGKAEAVVFATGGLMQIGKITKLVAQTTSRSSFEQMLEATSNFILKLTLLALAVILAANLVIKGRETDIGDLLLFTIALAVGIVPEALPVVSLFTMGLGTLHLAKKKVVVKRLTALEDLGKIQVLCVDKTGTLTENKLTVAEILAPTKPLFRRFFMASVQPILNDNDKLRSYLDQVVYDYLKADEVKVPKVSLIIDEPFKPEVRKERLLLKFEGKTYLITKGAPEILLKNCAFEEKEGEKISLNLDYWQTLIKEEGQKGRRVYGMAVREVEDGKAWENDRKNHLGRKIDHWEKEMTFAGMVSFYDPVKKTAYQAVKKAEKLGLMVKILTGDSAPVAGWVAKEIGIIKDKSEVVIDQEWEKLNNSELKKMIFEKTVFARVTPEQKYKIVKILQEKYWTAFLGDGVNDAPALKLADVSLVVDKAADVAKEASDVILLKKDLKVILTGIEEGRRIFSNVLKYVRYTLASNFGNSYSLALVSLLIPFLPMLPTQILLVNLLSDFPLVFVATDRVDSEQLSRPVKFDLRQAGFLIVLLGLISMIFDFIFFAIFRSFPPRLLQTLWFVESILSEIIFIFSIRTHQPFWKASFPSFSLLGLSLMTILLTFFIPYTFLARDFSFAQPTLMQMVTVVLIVLLYLVTSETVKITYYRHFNNQ